MAYKTKVCSKCGREKGSSEFAKNNSKKDGLQTYCKECHNACCRDYAQNNKEKINAYNKAYAQGLKGHYLYIIYQGKRVAYIGSCSYLSTRISNHINCHSNIAKHMLNEDWTTIKSLDIGDRVGSKEEREYIEYMLIEELEPMWNGSTKHKRLENDEREADLGMEASDILENLEYYFTDYKENDNKCNFVIDEGNIQDYAEDISTFIEKYVEDDKEDEWE